jgi:hypothetical protein
MCGLFNSAPSLVSRDVGEAMTPLRRRVKRNDVMTSKTKTLLAALIVAAVATPALAEGYGYGHADRAPVVEGRNAAIVNPVVISGRESLVHAN